MILEKNVSFRSAPFLIKHAVLYWPKHNAKQIVASVQGLSIGGIQREQFFLQFQVEGSWVISLAVFYTWLYLCIL